METNYYNILYYFANYHHVHINSLKRISQAEMESLIKRFPYRMACIMKYGNTREWFDGKLQISKYNDCYDCQRDLFERTKYEVVTENSVDFICEDCYNKGGQG